MVRNISWRPVEVRDPLGDALSKFDASYKQGVEGRQEKEAPELFAQSAAPLSEYGLDVPPDQLKAMFANPNTRPQAIQLVQEATQRRADASDPFKRLQLEKMQLDVADARRGPAGPAPTAEMRNWQQAQADPKFAEFIGMNGMKNAPDIVKQYAYYRDQATQSGEQPVSFLEFKNYAAPEQPKPQTDLAKLKADLQAGLITPEQYNTAAANTLASGAPKPEGPLTSLAKLKADLEAGRISQDQYNGAVAKELAGGGGLSVQTNPDGTVSVTQGAATAPGQMPKLTEGQSKDVVYLTRGAGALPVLDEMGAALTDPVQQVMGVDPTGVVRGQQEPAFQQAEQAGREFLASVLRKDTGAAVTPSEMDTYGNMYLPKPGDTPELLAQKKGARQRALKAIELGIPSAAIVEMENRGALPGRGSDAPAGEAPAGFPDPSLWEFLTPQERALWQK